MTVVAGWLTNRGDVAGGQTRASTRVLPIGSMWPTGAMTVRSGLLPGGDPCRVTGAGMTVTVATGRAVVQGSASAGAYPVAVTAPDAVTITNGDASNPRRDLVGIRVYDSLVDASGQYLAKVEVLVGTPSPTPVDPTPPPGAVWLPLARLRIPAGASAGSPPTWASVIDDLRTYTTGHGGAPPMSGADLSTPGAYAGQARYNVTRGCEEVWSGTAWAAVGDYTSWTPAVLGSPNPPGTSGSGRYSMVGTAVRAPFAVTWGSGSSGGGGTYGLSLPVPARRLSGAELYMGSCQVTVGGTTFNGALLGPSGSGTITTITRIRLSDVTTAAGGGSANWAAASPSAPASGASIVGTLMYEAA